MWIWLDMALEFWERTSFVFVLQPFSFSEIICSIFILEGRFKLNEITLRVQFPCIFFNSLWLALKESSLASVCSDRKSREFHSISHVIWFDVHESNLGRNGYSILSIRKISISKQCTICSLHLIISNVIFRSSPK